MIINDSMFFLFYQVKLCIYQSNEDRVKKIFNLKCKLIKKKNVRDIINFHYRYEIKLKTNFVLVMSVVTK